MDVKIVILAVAVALGYVSHMVLKFPSDASGCAACLAGYWVIMATHWYIETYKDKGAFFTSKSHEMGQFKNWQKTYWFSEVVIAKDNMSAVYELTCEATSSDGREVNVGLKCPVTKVFDDKGYFHVRMASDLIIDAIFDKLQKEINKSV